MQPTEEFTPFPDAFRMMGEVAVYFEPAAVIVVLVLLGQVLELRARSRTSTAIRNPLSLAPETARRIDSDGSELDIPLEHVHVGDRLRVRPGERVPVDGAVIEGTTTIDESMVSGELEFPGFSGQTLAPGLSRRSDAKVQAPDPWQSSLGLPICSAASLGGVRSTGRGATSPSPVSLGSAESIGHLAIVNGRRSSVGVRNESDEHGGIRRKKSLSERLDCDRSVIRQAQNLEEHRGLRTHTNESFARAKPRIACALASFGVARCRPPASLSKRAQSTTLTALSRTPKTLPLRRICEPTARPFAPSTSTSIRPPPIIQDDWLMCDANRE